MTSNRQPRRYFIDRADDRTVVRSEPVVRRLTTPAVDRLTAAQSKQPQSRYDQTVSLLSSGRVSRLVQSARRKQK